MSTKITQMPEATEFKDGDLLMIVQDGQNKKIPASKFQPSDEPAENALQFQGYTASDFVKSADGIAYDSNRLGGVPASSYATKSDLNNLSNKVNAWNWCCPQLWFSKDVFPLGESLLYPTTQTDPNKFGITTHFAICAGQWLKVSDYKDLSTILNHAFDSFEQEGYFQIPDLRGRFAFGADLNQMRATQNLRNGIYQAQEGVITADGQWIYPQDIAMKGGDPTTTQDSVYQMASHKHEIKLNKTTHISIKTDSSYNEILARDCTFSEQQIMEGETAGFNESYLANVYPNSNFSPAKYNYGMLSMPPFLTFAYIMQIKPFE